VERPKELPRVVLLGGAHNPRLAALAAVLAMPSPGPIMAEAFRRQQDPAPPDVVIAPPSSGGRDFFRRARRQVADYFAPSIAPNADAILSKLNAFYAQRPRPWRPSGSRARIRRRAYTAPKARPRFLETTGATDYLHDSDRRYEVVQCT
jgi:hypothetical protein